MTERTSMGRWEAKARAISTKAALLGHTVSVEENAKGNVRAVCSCGYVSTYRRTLALAATAGVHHIGILVGQADADASNSRAAAARSSTSSGVSLPGSVAPGL